MTGGSTRRLVFGLVAMTAIAVEVSSRLLRGPGVLDSLLSNTFTQFAWAGSLLMYGLSEVRTAERARGLRIAAAVAVVIAGVNALMPLGALLATALVLLSVGAIGFAHLVAAAQRPAPEAARWADRLAATAIISLGVASAPFFLWLSSRVNPVDDLYVLAFEEALGPRFSVIGVRVFEAVPILAGAAGLAYLALPAGILAAQALRTRQHDSWGLVLPFALVTVVGFGLYFVFPVVGPLSIFGPDFPDRWPLPGTVMATEMIVAEGPPRNGMPSLHAAWAFLLWFGSRSLAARPRRSLRAFALLNLLATMGLRDAHWLTDLVVAMPLAVGVRGACEAALAGPTRARVQALVGGAAQVVLWFVALWYGAAWFAVVPGAAWTAVGVTLVASLMLERRLVTGHEQPSHG